MGLVLCLLLGLASCSTTDFVTGQQVYNLYTIQDDVQLGQSALKGNLTQLRQQGVKVNQDPARVAQLRSIMRRLTTASDRPGLPYDVTLIHTGIVNAAAFPGGQMIVFEGLYDPKKGLAQTDDEIAAVMAHEIAHVNCRHSTERLSCVMPMAMITEVGAAVAEYNDNKQLADGLRIAFAAGSSILIPMYSRKDEFEADRVGLFYMAKAGFDPRAAPRIWKRVADKGSDGNAISIFATHPSSGDRYKALNAILPYAMDEYAKSTGSYPKDYSYTRPMGTPKTFDWRLPQARER
ncbi:MAG: M48 family metallopeptidase [Lentisphaerota bacterium]